MGMATASFPLTQHEGRWLPQWCSSWRRKVVGDAPAVSSARQGREVVQRRPRPPPIPRLRRVGSRRTESMRTDGAVRLQGEHAHALGWRHACPPPPWADCCPPTRGISMLLYLSDLDKALGLCPTSAVPPRGLPQPRQVWGTDGPILAPRSISLRGLSRLGLQEHPTRNLPHGTPRPDVRAPRHVAASSRPRRLQGPPAAAKEDV
jgi:hypothetical protein